MQKCTPRENDGRKNKYIIDRYRIMEQNEAKTKFDENLIFRRLSEAGWLYSYEILKEKWTWLGI